MAWMAPSVGPMHGDQPMAKAAPSNGAPASPARGRQLTGAAYDRPSPRKSRPMSRTTAPPTRSSALWCSRKARPTAETAAAAMRKTTVKPRTKSPAARSDPEASSVPTRTSGLLGEDVVDEAEQGRRRDRTGDTRRDAGLVVEHERRRGGGGLALEGEDRDAAVVGQRRVGHVVGGLEGEPGLGALELVEADELDLLALRLHGLPGLLQRGRLLDAGWAPRAPDVDDEDGAGALGAAPRLALEGRAVELHRLAAVGGGQLLDGAVAGDVALAVTRAGLVRNGVRVGRAGGRERHEASGHGDGSPPQCGASVEVVHQAPTLLLALASSSAAGSEYVIEASSSPR